MKATNKKVTFRVVDRPDVQRVLTFPDGDEFSINIMQSIAEGLATNPNVWDIEISYVPAITLKIKPE